MRVLLSVVVKRHPSAVFLVIFVLANGACMWAADGPGDDGKKQARVELNTKEASPIQDNSFLIEEAYNQEFGVVQHINTFTRSWYTHSWVYTFTQEWPVPGQTNKMSYTLSYLSTGGTPNRPVEAMQQ